MKNKSLSVTYGAVIAALYTLLTLLSSAFGLSSNIIQVRFSEMLCILPVFTPIAVPGLFVGCIISNLITGCAPYDIILGSLATLIGAFGTYLLRHKNICLAILPPIISNTLIIPLILSFVYRFDGSLLYFGLTVFAGEFISCGILGLILYRTLQSYKSHLFH